MADGFEFELSESSLVKHEQTRPEMMILYGPPGNGKTHLALSASEVEGLYPMLVIDAEGSTVGVIENFDQSRIDVMMPQKTHKGKEYAAVVATLENLLTKSHKYKSVVIDTADVVQEWSIAAGRQNGDGFAHWNFTHSELTAPPSKYDRGLLHRLKAANFLVILVIHDKQEALNEEGTLMYANVQWQGQGKTKIGGIPDMVGYVTRDTNSAGVSKSTLHTAPTKRSLAKNRFGLPAKVEDPSMSKIINLIDNKEDK